MRGGVYLKLHLSIEGKTEIERLLLVLNIGFLTALEKGIFKIEEVEGYIYNPYSVQKLQEFGMGIKLIDLISLGCELEDVESLIPEKLEKTIQDLREKSIDTLKSIPKPVLPTQRLIARGDK
jgi:hypothetical protein